MAMVFSGRVGLHARGMLISDADASHLCQSPPLQVGKQALGRHDQQVITAALPHVEPERR
jgi:hypothetical protein